MGKLPVNKGDKDNKKGYRIIYDYRKRNSGGFVDALILGAIMFTGFMWIMLYIAVK